MIEFEHTIFILLLLSGVLNAKPPRQRWATLIILIGVMLVFIPPAHSIKLPWDLILGLVIPLLLWQNIRRIVNADWQGWKSVALWGISVLVFSFALWFGGALNWPGAVLFGVIAASMIWRAGEPESGASYMSQVGPLTLIFLLTEVEVAIQSPDHYFGGIFSGAFFGVVTASIGLYFLRKASPKFHSWIGIGQVYLAYWLSFSVGVSAVAAALVSVMMFVWLNQYYKLGFHEKAPLAPLNTWPGFSFVLVLFLLLGWQAHQPVSTLLIIEVIVGALIGLSITWLGYRWEIPAFQKQRSFWLAGLRAAVLLFPALLIWPRNILQQPTQLAVAIGITVLVIGMSYMGLSFYFPRKNIMGL
ncbi:MAG: hypothetical protein KKD28_07420 [Chloroflexi bacterium]|nr:hypothetical protein [Chloroflexota bacterium]